MDSLDEFFDFTQLEEDNNVYGNPMQAEASALDLPMLGADHAMDWQPTIEPMMGDMRPFTIPLEFPLTVPGETTQNPFHAVPMPSLVQNVPMDPQLSAHAHSGGSSYSWQLPPMLREEEVVPIGQELNRNVRPYRSNTVTRKPASAKRKGPSTRLPVEARQILEEEYSNNPYPCSWEIDIIAHQANLDVKRVRNWFNNTRARKKPDSSGSSFPSPSDA
jgi:hypothetical protein